jgi:hypothetical protein
VLERFNVANYCYVGFWTHNIWNSNKLSLWFSPWRPGGCWCRSCLPSPWWTRVGVWGIPKKAISKSSLLSRLSHGIRGSWQNSGKFLKITVLTNGCSRNCVRTFANLVTHPPINMLFGPSENCHPIILDNNSFVLDWLCGCCDHPNQQILPGPRCRGCFQHYESYLCEGKLWYKCGHYLDSFTSRD